MNRSYSRKIITTDVRSYCQRERKRRKTLKYGLNNKEELHKWFNENVIALTCV